MMGGRKQNGDLAMIRKIGCLFAALAVLAAAGPATAQVPKKIPTIGFLHPASFGQNKRVPHFLQGLRDHGYVEGRNIRIAWRFADGEQDRLPALAADLVKQKVDVIVCVGASAQAARDATSTIPIVVLVAGDHVAMGLAKRTLAVDKKKTTVSIEEKRRVQIMVLPPLVKTTVQNAWIFTRKYTTETFSIYI